MSFTVTNRSLIRFESAKKDDELMRALMFFNVDISGGVCCGRRNEITAPRTSDCNGKRELINDMVAGEKDLLSLGALREDQHISPIGGALVHPVAAEYRVVELLKAFLHLRSIVAQWICLQCDSQQKAHVEKAIRQGIHIKYQAKQDNCDINANN